MSRIAPASIRLTAGFLNYDQVGASNYYFQSHLKEGIALDQIIGSLNHNLGFATARQKRRFVPLLVMGILPIYSQLRAKKLCQRIISKSADWFVTKLFRGSQSRTLHYHNTTVFSKGINNLSRTDSVSHESILPVFQTFATTEEFYSNNQKSRFTYNVIKSTKPEKLSILAIKNRNTVANLKTIKKQKKLPITSNFITSLFPLTFSKSQKEITKSRVKTYSSIKPWSIKSLFAFYNCELIIGKKSQTNCIYCPMPNNPLTTKSYTNRITNKKKRSFYDVQTLQKAKQLTTSTTEPYKLNFQKANNIVRSQIDKVKSVILDSTGVRLNTTSKTKTTKDNDDSIIQIMDFTRCVKMSKTNVAPKFWLSRTFQADPKIHMFSIIEGRFNSGHNKKAKSKSYRFQRSSSVASYFAGWKHLKSAFVFEFNLCSTMTQDTKSLRPTISLRF